MSFLFQNSRKTANPPANPAYAALRINSSVMGQPVTVAFGVPRLAGNLIDRLKFKAIPHTSTQTTGGKGGTPPASSQTTYTYECDFLLAFGEGGAAGWRSIRRMWAGKGRINPGGFNWFLGTTPQSPWGYLSSNYPARALHYPGLVYCAASGYNLGDSDALPAFGIEAVTLLPWTGSYKTVTNAAITLPQQTPAQENYTISDPYTYAVLQASSFAYDYGVVFGDTGVPLTRVDGNPSTYPAQEAYLIAMPGSYPVAHAATFAGNVGVYYQGTGSNNPAQESYIVASPGAYTVLQAANYNGNIGAYYQDTGTTDPTQESYTIAAPGTYSTLHAANFVADNGVFYADTGVPLTRVDGVPAVGQYALAAGVYTFNTAASGGGLGGGGGSDLGRGVIVKYTYTAAISGQALTLVSGSPAAGQYAVNNGVYTFNVAGDSGKTIIIKYYYGNYKAGQALTQVASNPGQGQYCVDASGNYTFNANDGQGMGGGYGDGGRTVVIHYNYTNTLAPGCYKVTPAGVYTFNSGDAGRPVIISYFYGGATIPVYVGADGAHLNAPNAPPPSSLFGGWVSQPAPPPTDPGWDGFKEDLGVCYANGAALTRVTGTPAKGQYAVSAAGVYTCSGLDSGASLLISYTYWCFIGANPAEIIPAILTNPYYGLGFDPAEIADLSNFAKYCLAHNILISPVYSEQKTGTDVLTQLALVTHSEIFESAGQIKAVPFADAPATANEVTWTPDLTPLYDLTDDNFLGSATEDPVQLNWKSLADCYNSETVIFCDADNPDDPHKETPSKPARDLADIKDNGLREMDTVTCREITQSDLADWLANMRMQDSLHNRAQATFRLGWNFPHLERMDIVTLTTSRGSFSLYRQPVRLRSIKRNDTGDRTVQAELLNIGTASAARYTLTRGGGDQPDLNAYPGMINPPVIFFPPKGLMESPLEVWIGVSGNNVKWGGCELWCSYDGVTYRYVGTIRHPARHGIVTAFDPYPLEMSYASAPSLSSGERWPFQVLSEGEVFKTNLDVDLSISKGSLTSGTVDDLANLRTLCYFLPDFSPGNYLSPGPGLVAFQNAELTGSYKYRLTTLSRIFYQINSIYQWMAPGALYGAQFMYLDSNIYKFALPPAADGHTIYVKFLSFNIHGLMRQGLEDVNPYPISVNSNDIIAYQQGGY